MAAIIQTTLSNIFLSETYNFISISLKFVPKDPIEKSQTRNGSYNVMAPNRRQDIIGTDEGLIYWRIYTSFGLDEYS